MVQHLALLLLFSLSFSVFAQDERYYRQILSGQMPSLNKETETKSQPQFNVRGAAYQLDLNSDGIEEQIQPQKRDGVDWIEIKNANHQKVFEAKLLAMGGESSIYKARLVNLSPKVKALILFLDEGKTNSRKFESTARIYVLSYEDNDLSSMKMTEGPHHFHEKESQRDQYWRRDYSVEVRDVDKDGIRDIIVQFNHIQRILRYKGEGVWERI